MSSQFMPEDEIGVMNLGFFSNKVVLELSDYLRNGERKPELNSLMKSVSSLFDKYRNIGSAQSYNNSADNLLRTPEEVGRFNDALKAYTQQKNPKSLAQLTNPIESDIKKILEQTQKGAQEGEIKRIREFFHILGDECVSFCCSAAYAF